MSSIHGGNIYAALRKQGSNVNTLLDFSANINPLGLADSIRQQIGHSLESIIHYPDVDAYDLKTALATYYQVRPEQITVGNGAVELMYVLCHTLKPHSILVTAPTFSEYQAAATVSGAAIDYLYLSAENDFAVNVQTMIDKLSNVDLVFICNPNNPTGTLLSNDQLKELLNAAKAQNSYVAVDESFIDFLPDDSTYTCRHLVDQYPNLIIFHSLTKFYAIPGLRLGFSLASPALTEQLHRGKDPWNVNTLAQAAGVAALQDQQYQQQSKDMVASEKQALYQAILAIPGLKPYPPSVNFMLIDCKDTKLTSLQLKELLAAQHILIRDCSNYPGLSADYIRIAVKSPAQNKILIDTLQKVIGE